MFQILPLVIGFGIIQGLLNAQMRDLDSAAAPPAVERQSKMDPGLFKVLTFGHLPAAIDWLWIQTLADPEMSHVPPGRHPSIYYHLDLASDLDPAFYEAYYVGANLIAVVRDDGIGARDLLLKGEGFRKNQLPTYPLEFREKYWKNAWRVPMMLGYVYLFELDDLPRAAAAFGEAAKLTGAPDFLRKLDQRLRKPGGIYETGFRLLGFMIKTAQDQKLAERLQQRWNSLQVSKFMFDLNTSFQEFSSQGKRKPSSPEDLWKRFLEKTGHKDRDSWGGKLSLNEKGRVVTTTPYAKVFGLE